MPKLLRSATFRLAALYLLLFAASALVLAAAIFLAARSALEQQMAARIETETEFLREQFRSRGIAHLLELVRTRGRGASALDYLVTGPGGDRLVGEMPVPPALRPGWMTLHTEHAREDEGRSETVRAMVSRLDGGIVLVVGDDVGRIEEIEEAIGTAFLWTVSLAALLGIGGGVLLSRAFLRRVDAITGTAEAIIGGDLARRVPVRGTDDDLDRLAATLNRMLDRIAMLMESLRQVSSDVAHDLRTPLSRLYQRLERARSNAGTLAGYQAAVDGALREAEALLDTFAALLRIAQVEGASAHDALRRVDLGAVAAAVADAYLPDAEEAGHRILVEAPSGLCVDGDKELLTQAIANLVENALRHTPPGTTITLRLRPDAGHCVRLSVEDNGPGVDEHDLPRLADRFYRGERSRTTPGNGLGLSLVAAVAHLHKAQLDIVNTGPGLRIELLFPRARTAAGKGR